MIGRIVLRCAIVIVGAFTLYALLSGERLIRGSKQATERPLDAKTHQVRKVDELVVDAVNEQADAGPPPSTLYSEGGRSVDSQASSGGVLSDSEIVDVLFQVQRMQAASLKELETSTEEEELLLACRTMTKLRAAPAKILEGKYEVSSFSKLHDLRETRDQTFLAFPVAGRHMVLRFSRSEDVQVFATVDSTASVQQDSWQKTADSFNALPAAERERRIERHRECQRLLAQISRQAPAPTVGGDINVQRLLDARKNEIGQLQADLLPYYLLIKKGSNLVWTRRSIGR